MSKVAAIQMVSTGDVDENLAAASRLIGSAAEQGAELVLLPEVFAVLEGGPMRGYGEVEGSGKIQDFLAQQARDRQLILVGGTIPLLTRPRNSANERGEAIEDDRVRPACLVFDDCGVQIARYDKMHLFDVRIDDRQARYSESRSYEAGTDIVTLNTPLGHLGLSVCYDIRFPEFYRELFSRGVEIVTVPAAFTAVTGEAHWETLLRARAIENQCYVIAAAQGGRHNEKRETWGHSMVIDPWGSILSQIDKGEGIALAEIDLDYLNKIRAKMPIAEQRKM
ncbi:MAG: carbon-nitrogen hydrolase family protein [Proteobacteria bacterium]|nr:carbon-nitrogen hydrolase family protein [Pseudomonadota bacterium]